MMVPNDLNRLLSGAAMFIVVFTSGFTTQGQHDTTALNRKRLNTLVIAAGVGYTAGLATLNHVWYKNNERQSFHFFNDNAEWKQVDKVGHLFSSFQLSDLASRALKYTGVPTKRANIIGAVSGFLLTLPIEVFDGFSEGYGASPGDIIADVAGPAIFLGQHLLWDEIRIQPKFSFHRTGYAPKSPDLLGDNLLSELVKDYNGQTYWLSVDVDKFATFPKWLNVAVGYGAQDMVRSRDYQNEYAGFSPYRQYYLAVDLDLSAIKTRSRLLKSVLYVLNTVRLPAPALEVSDRGAKFHPFYF